MTVKELKAKLDQYPDEIEVFIVEVDTGFKYNPVEQVRAEKINFQEEPGGKTLASSKVVVIDTFQ